GENHAVIIISQELSATGAVTEQPAGGVVTEESSIDGAVGAAADGADHESSFGGAAGGAADGADHAVIVISSELSATGGATEEPAGGAVTEESSVGGAADGAADGADHESVGGVAGGAADGADHAVIVISPELSATGGVTEEPAGGAVTK
ncbi:hypothetical protein V8G54_023721, partial [Vigna mungo]